MKRILFLAHVDINQKGGAGLATLAFYNAINSLYEGQVDLLLPAESAYSGTGKIIRVPSRNRLQAILSLSPHRYKGFLNKFLKENSSKYDVCVLNGGIYAGDMVDMIHRYGLKVMVIHHNFDREYYLDNKASITLHGRTGIVVEHLEKKAYTKADVNCFLTPQDQALFERFYGKSTKPSFVIQVFEPYTVKTEEPSKEIKNQIVVSGSLNTVQTITGINDIKENYYDIIRKICPQWELVLAGRNPGSVIYDFQKTNPDYIKIIPNPADMNDVTKNASIFLCPTNVGGGLKLRVMDGLRQGLPILVHSVSARGYDPFYDKEYFRIYNDKQSFYKGLSDLLELCHKGLDRAQIQREYYESFSFEAGRLRIQKAVVSCFV